MSTQLTKSFPQDMITIQLERGKTSVWFFYSAHVEGTRSSSQWILEITDTKRTRSRGTLGIRPKVIYLVVKVVYLPLRTTWRRTTGEKNIQNDHTLNHDQKTIWSYVVASLLMDGLCVPRPKCSIQVHLSHY